MCVFFVCFVLAVFVFLTVADEILSVCQWETALFLSGFMQLLCCIFMDVLFSLQWIWHLSWVEFLFVFCTC